MADKQTPQQVDAARVGAFTNGAYNADREAYLDRQHRWLMFAVIVFGASALADMLPPVLRQLATAVAAFAGAFDLVFDLGTRARRHSYLRHEHFRIAARLTDGSLDPTAAEAAMLELAADEEPPYYAVHALAENWATMAVYGDSNPTPCKVGYLARRLRHWVRFDGRSFACPPVV